MQEPLLDGPSRFLLADFIFLSLMGFDLEPASFYMIVVSPRYFWYKLPLLFLTISSLTYYALKRKKIDIPLSKIE